MLVQLGERICDTPEAFKAWSQNLGHERMLTTLTSYGTVSPHRQAELIRSLGNQPAAKDMLDDPDIAELITRIRNKAAI
jgi:hypothetical protein